MPLVEITQTKKIKLQGVEVKFTNKVLKHIPNTNYGFEPEPSVISQSVRLFKYDYVHASIVPHLFTNSKGEKFIIPTWQPVHPDTQFEDINWIKPEIKEKPKEKNTWTFESSSEKGLFYTVRQNGLKLSCNCSGFFRAKDRRCKHIKEVEQIIKK
jgi:hypothetical protein